MTPIPMYLTCPKCNARHIDEGEFATKPHHTHSCQSCGLTWRPTVGPTVGVAFLPGFKSGPEPTKDRVTGIRPDPSDPVWREPPKELAPVSDEEVEREVKRQFVIFENASNNAVGDGYMRAEAGRKAVARDKLESEARLRTAISVAVEGMYRRSHEITSLVIERDDLRAKLEEADRDRQNWAERVHAVRLATEQLVKELAAERAEPTDEQVEAGVIELEDGPESDRFRSHLSIRAKRDAVRAIYSAVREAKGKAAPAPVSPPAWSEKQREAVRAVFAEVENLSACGPRQLARMAADAWLAAGREETT